MTFQYKETEIEITRIVLDRFGYARNGKYYGTGLPVYEMEASSHHKNVYISFRAANFAAAKMHAKDFVDKQGWVTWPYS